ncbi:hypothetical protein B0O80DRAFT_501931 [Mortierella sp. GBAus27b]|nr:hypothetical protein B0O80DRAFT_501931 [Mortierella sp. GBAus27b]
MENGGVRASTSRTSNTSRSIKAFKYTDHVRDTKYTSQERQINFQSKGSEELIPRNRVPVELAVRVRLSIQEHAAGLLSLRSSLVDGLSLYLLQEAFESSVATIRETIVLINPEDRLIGPNEMPLVINCPAEPPYHIPSYYLRIQTLGLDGKASATLPTIRPMLLIILDVDLKTVDVCAKQVAGARLIILDL